MAERKIAGTNEVYTGMVVKLGEFEYTTVGGGIEGDRQQLEPMDTTTDVLDDVLPPVIQDTVNADSPITDFQYLEDYDIGTDDGVLNAVDAIYWNNLGRNDIAQFITQFIVSGNMPPNRPTQGGQSGNQNNNQQNQQGGGGMSENQQGGQGGQADMGTNQQNQQGGGGMSENTGNNPGGNVGGNGNQGGGGGMY